MRLGLSTQVGTPLRPMPQFSSHETALLRLQVQAQGIEVDKGEVLHRSAMAPRRWQLLSIALPLGSITSLCWRRVEAIA